jgi:hypothetical protein
MNFNIGTNCGSHFPLTAACFGLLRYLPIDEDVLSDCYREGGGGDEEISLFEIEASNLKYIDFIPSKENSMQAAAVGVPNLLKHLQATMQDLPMFKGCYEVKPRQGLFRLFVGNLPADKVLLGLMIARASCQHFRGYSYFEGYKALVDKKYSPRVAMLGHLFSKGAGLVADNSYSLTNMNESAIFNPHTFGIKSIIAFLRQDENYNPWVQDPLCDGGYSRESDFSGDKEGFNLRTPSNTDQSWNKVHDMEERRAYSNYGLGTRYRSLTDCFSVKGDYTHFTSEIKSNTWGEFETDEKITSESYFKLFDFFEWIRKGT